MSDGKRLGLMGIAFVILQFGVLLFMVFFLGVRPHQEPGLLHFISLAGGFVLAGISFWMLRIALRPSPPEHDA